MPYALQLYQHTRGSEAVHPSHSTGDITTPSPAPLRSPSNPHFKRSSAISLRIRSLQEKGLVEDLPPNSATNNLEVGSSDLSSSSSSSIQTDDQLQLQLLRHRLFGQPTLLSLNTKIGPQHATTVQVQKLGGRISPYSCSACIPCPCPCPLCLIELRKMRQSSASRRSGCAVGRRAVRDALANPLLCWHSVPTLTVVCQGMLLYYDLCQGAPFLLSSHPTSPDNYILRCFRNACCVVSSAFTLLLGSRIHAPGQTRGRTFRRAESLCDHEDYILDGRDSQALRFTQETDGRTKRIVANRPTLLHGKPHNPRITTNA